MTLHAPQTTTSVRRYVPGLASIVDGARTSALTVWAVVVPLSLAYTTLASVPTVHGLHAAVGGAK